MPGQVVGEGANRLAHCSRLRSGEALLAFNQIRFHIREQRLEFGIGVEVHGVSWRPGQSASHVLCATVRIVGYADADAGRRALGAIAAASPHSVIPYVRIRPTVV